MGSLLSQEPRIGAVETVAKNVTLNYYKPGFDFLYLIYLSYYWRKEWQGELQLGFNIIYFDFMLEYLSKMCC